MRPMALSVPEPESIYPPPSAAREDEGENQGAMHYRLEVSFLNRYVYRGMDQTPAGTRSENALQFNGTAELNLGNLPHPFVGLFSNIFDHDPVSRFEEIRPLLRLPLAAQADDHHRRLQRLHLSQPRKYLRHPGSLRQPSARRLAPPGSRGRSSPPSSTGPMTSSAIMAFTWRPGFAMILKSATLA